MDTVCKYKGVVLKENTLGGYLAGEGRYAIYLTDGSRITIESIAEFKRAVNGTSFYDAWNKIDSNRDWSHACTTAEFREYAIKNQIQ